MLTIIKGGDRQENIVKWELISRGKPVYHLSM